MIDRNGEIFYPEPLRKGDKIAIISPASSIKEEYVMGAYAKILERGYEPIVTRNAIGHESGSYASTKEARLNDLFDVLEDNEIKAILCSRGGYGCVQLLADLSYNLISSHPKWIIGYSDVSALLAMWYKSDIASIHGPMAKHLATEPFDQICTEALFNILENGGKFDYYFPSSSLNRQGEAKGVLRGGNLAVLNDLADTPYDLLRIGYKEDVILFFEDISEPIYAVERMLMRLYYSGTLMTAKGLIFGQFTNYKPDKNFGTMEEMIKALIDRYVHQPIPVVFDFPVGHVNLNYPLTVGAKVELTVNKNEVNLRTIN